MQPQSTHLIHSNTNYKVICRIKPHSPPSQMISINDSSLSIRDPTSRSQESQNFNFNALFDSTATQETIFRYVCENNINKILEGHNSCVLSYGQTGSGKSFTMFGEDDKYTPGLDPLYQEKKKDRRGLVVKSVEYLFKRGKEMEESREFVISCSMFEIYLDQVRDLGREYEEREGEGEKNVAGGMIFFLWFLFISLSL